MPAAPSTYFSCLQLLTSFNIYAISHFDKHVSQRRNNRIHFYVQFSLFFESLIIINRYKSIIIKHTKISCEEIYDDRFLHSYFL
ncbi:hypothetical protein EAF09_09645 [Staphylococcus pseudintermedius]|nr:hypothetical protein [Staphylococcus pseudintermedius]